MANFITLIDPDRERRIGYIDKIKPLLALVEGLTLDSFSTEDFCVAWAASPQAPITSYCDDREAAVIWGEAITQVNSDRIDATHLKDLWNRTSDRDLSPWDGFYAAISYHSSKGLTVGADLFGLFPIYYWSQGDVILVGSSPELFRYHPLFEAKFNPAGLVGILLTNGLFDGQTLWQKVKRLKPAHLLTWQANSLTQEIEQYRIADLTSKQYYQDELLEQIEVLDQALDRALSSQIDRQEESTLMLSGGLDSRLVAGILHRQGVKPRTLTLGKRSDLEMECASAVARTLGYSHQGLDIPYQQYLANAQLMDRWEHLANGYNNVMDWSIHSRLKELTPKVIAGYLMDRVVGGSPSNSPPPEALSFKTFFENVNSWGFKPEVLNQLLRQEVFGDLVPETLTRLRQVYQSYSEVEFRRAWWFEIFHSNRFHVGSTAWRLCFGAWPILPVLNFQLLKTLVALPDSTIANRKGEKKLLCHQFPQLAGLPLDLTTEFSIDPLLPSKNRQLLAPWFSLQSKFRKLQQKLGWERRYCFRTYDLNNPGWLAIRQQAELSRKQVEPLFNMDVFDSLLSPPDLSIPCKQGRDSLKLLIGFMLWSENHL
jgi:asparagine synthase (glutamine-hydrolysing)